MLSVIEPIFGNQWGLPYTSFVGRIRRNKEKPHILQDLVNPNTLTQVLRDQPSACSKAINDICTKDTRTNSWLPAIRTSRDRWAQPGEKNEESTLIKVHGHCDSPPRPILRIAFRLLQKQRKERGSLAYITHHAYLLLVPVHLPSTLACKAGLHPLITMPHSTPWAQTRGRPPWA